MFDSFADGALLLAGHAARALGWPPDIFWNATPAELAACLASNDDARTPPSRDEIAALIERDRNG
ncbi:phage tail assembly chaperone [Qipengyuania seohaensis]|uniref:phage tail assembly chaperone n=1 Tax=Qipengyuania seohaensis TaxID=266951 RepID=UPI000C22DC48|nr:phage tail assembly chaperone [Qipengyuania seohaensis]